MNSVLESSYAWTGSFFEAINQLTCDVASIIFSSLSLTSNTSSDSSSSGSSSSSSDIVSSNNIPVATVEKDQTSFPQSFEEFLSLFAFDDFQYILLKIFTVILLTNIGLICLVWHIYGTKISERFMTSNISQAELKRSVSELKLPKEHSQRHS